MSSRVLLFLALVGQFFEAQADPSCFNGAFVNTSSSTCICPPGFIGSDCSSAQCGGNPFETTRSAVALGSSINDCSCDAGWTGLDCDICTSLTVCDSAYRAAGGQYSSFSGSNSTANSTLTCNSAPVVVNVGSTSCNVNDSTISSELGGQTSITFQRREKPQRSPFVGENTPNDTSALSLQIWDNGVEQISCAAGACESLNDVEANRLFSQWDCFNVSCACLPNASFCGTSTNGSGTTNLTSLVNSVSGNLTVRCPPEQNEDSSNAPVSTCAITQSGLSAMFNVSGDIMLSSCAFGECVWQFDFTDEGLNKTKMLSSARMTGCTSFGLSVVAALIVVPLVL